MGMWGSESGGGGGGSVAWNDVTGKPASASQAEMEAGTEAGTRQMSPLRVAQAIAALGGGGGGGGGINAIAIPEAWFTTNSITVVPGNEPGYYQISGAELNTAGNPSIPAPVFAGHNALHIVLYDSDAPASFNVSIDPSGVTGEEYAVDISCENGTTEDIAAGMSLGGYPIPITVESGQTVSSNFIVNDAGNLIYTMHSVTPPGAAGGATVWRDGDGAPSNALGADGDYYLDNITGNVYERTSGTYAVVTNIMGPSGVNGADGGDAIGTTAAVTYTAGGTTTIDIESGHTHFTATAAMGGTTWSVTGLPGTGEVAGFILDLTNGGSQTQTYPAGSDFDSGVAPDLTPAGKDRLVWFYDGSAWSIALALKDFK